MNFKKWVKSIQTAGYDGVRKVVQKTYQNLTMLNAHVWFVFEFLLLSFYKVRIILKR
jgi:hypothetical protein